MLDQRPTAAQTRVMRADAQRVRAQAPTHDFRTVVIDDAARTVHDSDCHACAEMRERRAAVAS